MRATGPLAKIALALLAAAAGMGLTMADAAQAKRAPFGKMADGSPVEAVTLSNGKGTSIRLMTQGATIQSVMLPDRNGKTDDVALGYDTAAEYLANPQYFGASIGRYANRIARGHFTLDGKTYTLAAQNNGQALHGGLKGFDKRMWKIDSVTSGPTASVTMSYTSPDGEEGYPGTLKATVTYSLNEANEFTITYGATTDKPTIVNLTNHNFWNIAGLNSGRSVEGQLLTIHASRYTPVDKVLIPTGQLAPVAGTPLDFRKAAVIGPRVRDGRNPQVVIGRGIDLNYVVDGKAGTMRPSVKVEDPISGRVLELSQEAPGVQVYTGNFLDGTAVGKGHVYRMTDAIALEPQVFPDTPNHPAFGSARLNPGQTYRNTFVYKFSVAK
jgi:aldose 1-epimerase